MTVMAELWRLGFLWVWTVNHLHQLSLRFSWWMVGCKAKSLRGLDDRWHFRFFRRSTQAYIYLLCFLLLLLLFFSITLIFTIILILIINLLFIIILIFVYLLSSTSSTLSVIMGCGLSICGGKSSASNKSTKSNRGNQRNQSHRSNQGNKSVNGAPLPTSAIPFGEKKPGSKSHRRRLRSSWSSFERYVTSLQN